MDNGYIKLYRQSLDSGIIQNAQLWQFLSWCLLKASYKTRKQIVGNQEVILQPGQFVFGRPEAIRELKSTDSKIRTCLKNLIMKEFLTIKTTNKYSIITIVNWHIYQSGKNEDDQQNDHNLTRTYPSVDHKQEKKKRINNNNNINKPPIAPLERGASDRGESDVPLDFSKFWQAYPKKQAKKAALIAWKKSRDKPPIEKILAALERQKTWDQWTKDAGQYIPNPATWINRGQWADEAIAARASPVAPLTHLTPYQQQRACQQSLAMAVLQADMEQEKKEHGNGGTTDYQGGNRAIVYDLSPADHAGGIGGYG